MTSYMRRSLPCIANILTPFPSSCVRPATDNLQHPGHNLHRRERPEAALPGPALWSLLQWPQSSQYGRRRTRQHQSERQRSAGGWRAGQQGCGTHNHLSATWDVHHLYWDHHHPVDHHHPETPLHTYYSGTAAVDLRDLWLKWFQASAFKYS